MSSIRPQDVVRLRHTPLWIAVVEIVEVELQAVFVAHPVANHVVWAWLPIDWLELVPEEIEVLVA